MSLYILDRTGHEGDKRSTPAANDMRGACQQILITLGLCHYAAAVITYTLCCCCSVVRNLIIEQWCCR